MSAPTQVALIGLGMVSGTYGDALGDLTEKIALKGVFARSADARTAFCESFPSLGAKPYASLDDVVADPDVGFAILTTPPNARVEIVEALAGAGKHILMEKPVERSLSAATALVETCEAAGVTLGIMLQHRARPAATELRRIIDSGALGVLHMVEASVPWWRPQSYYAEPGRGTYARDGGGVLISQAIHTLDLMLSLTGPASEVTALTANTGFHSMESEDFVSGGLTFANGAVGQVFTTTASYPGRGETITLHYAHGSAHLDTNLLTITWQDGRSETFGAPTTSGAGADPMAFTSDWHRAVIEDFDEAIRNGRPPLVPGREALGVHRLIAALEESGQTGTRVAVQQG